MANESGLTGESGMTEELYRELEHRVMDWYESLNEQNSRDTPIGQARIPPFLIQDGRNFTLKTANPNNPTATDQYLLPAQFANQRLSTSQNNMLRDLVIQEILNYSQPNGGKKRTRRKTKHRKTKRRKTKHRKTKHRSRRNKRNRN